MAENAAAEDVEFIGETVIRRHSRISITDLESIDDLAVPATLVLQASTKENHEWRNSASVCGRPCVRCLKTITDEKGVSIQSVKAFHEQCLKCSYGACQRQLSKQEPVYLYEEKDGKQVYQLPYCRKHRLYTPEYLGHCQSKTCIDVTLLGRPITKVNGKTYHEACVHCKVCSCDFPHGKGLYVSQGDFYCKEHFEIHRDEIKRKLSNASSNRSSMSSPSPMRITEQVIEETEEEVDVVEVNAVPTVIDGIYCPPAKSSNQGADNVRTVSPAPSRPAPKRRRSPVPISDTPPSSQSIKSPQTIVPKSPIDATPEPVPLTNTQQTSRSCEFPAQPIPARSHPDSNGDTFPKIVKKDRRIRKDVKPPPKRPSKVDKLAKMFEEKNAS